MSTRLSLTCESSQYIFSTASSSSFTLCGKALSLRSSQDISYRKIFSFIDCITPYQTRVLIQALLLCLFYHDTLSVILLLPIHLTVNRKCTCDSAWAAWRDVLGMDVDCDSCKDRRMLHMYASPLKYYFAVSLIFHTSRWLGCMRIPTMVVAPLLVALYSSGNLEFILQPAKDLAKQLYLRLLSHFEKIWLLQKTFCFRIYIAYRNRVDNNSPGRPTETAAPFQYKQIGQFEIRLLKLVRAHPLAEATCHLIALPTTKTPRYEAISYTWGNPDKPANLSSRAGALQPRAMLTM
jgi:hypothetical protein